MWVSIKLKIACYHGYQKYIPSAIHLPDKERSLKYVYFPFRFQYQMLLRLWYSIIIFMLYDPLLFLLYTYHYVTLSPSYITSTLNCFITLLIYTDIMVYILHYLVFIYSDYYQPLGLLFIHICLVHNHHSILTIQFSHVFYTKEIFQIVSKFRPQTSLSWKSIRHGQVTCLTWNTHIGNHGNIDIFCEPPTFVTVNVLSEFNDHRHKLCWTMWC